MKILYDHQIFTWQKFGGISRYFSEIISNLPSEFEVYNSGIFSNNVYVNSNLKNIYSPFLPNVIFKGNLKEKLMELPNKLNSIYLLREKKFDVFHPTNYDYYFLKYNKKPFVITIHDMTHEKYLANDKATIELKKILALKSNQIITVSENTKKDILFYYKNISSDKITVISHGNSLIKQTDVHLDWSFEYILYIGDRNSYKNFTPFIRSISSILLQRNICLVCTGKPFNEYELQLFKSLRIEKLVVYKFVNDKQLYSLYNNAIAFVFPSLYEGFGIPILEAFSANCPVILSNRSSLPEVAGDAAAYFDPLDEIDMKNVINSTIENEQYRKFLVSKGQERLKYFDWKNAALKTAKVYENCLK